MSLEQLVLIAGRPTLMAMGTLIAGKLLHECPDESLRGAILEAVDRGIISRIQATDALELYTRTIANE